MAMPYAKVDSARSEITSQACEWLRCWYRVGRARCGRRGLILIEEPEFINSARTASLMSELRDDDLKSAVKDLLKPNFPPVPRRPRKPINTSGMRWVAEFSPQELASLIPNQTPCISHTISV